MDDITHVIGPRPAWHRDAACKGSTLDFTNIKSRPNVKACLELCGRCAVRVDCLRWAVDEVADSVAILGGCDGPTRKPLIRERQRQLAQRQQPANDEEITT